MKNIRSTCFKLLIPTIVALSLSACGGGGSSNSVDANAPSLAFTDPQSTWDLNNYTQTASIALQVGTGANLLNAEASGVTYDKDNDSLFVIGDGGTSVVRVDKTDGHVLDSMVLNAGDFADTEGITYVGAGKFVLVEERLRQVDLFTYVAGTTLTRAQAQSVKLGTTVANVGIEGVTFDPKTNGYIAVRQSQPTSIFQAAINFAAGATGTATAPDGSAINSSTVNPPFLFDASLAGLSAFNDVFALSNIVPTTAPDYDSLLIIGAPDGKIVKMDRTGKLLSSLSMSTTAQNEGVTMGPDGTIYAAGEQAAGPSLPGLTIFKPTTGKTNVGVGSNLYLTFDQSVKAGAGNIILSNGAGDTRTIAVTDTTQVTFNGSVMKVHPKFFMVPNTTYNITYAAGVIKTTSGSDISAVSGASALSFTTIGTLDTTALTLSSIAPVNNATGITGSHFTLFFNKAVQAGTGNIVITNNGNAGDTRTVSITDTTQVKFNGGVVSITLSTPLDDSASYTVQMGSGVVTDLSGNPAASISSSFTTAAAGAPAPTILITEVNSNADDKFDFFELYNYGSAPVDLTGWKWGDSHADVNDPNNTAAFAAGKTIAPGGRLVVVSDTPAHLTTFLTDWNLVAGDGFISMLDINNDASNPIGLGKADAVIVYDANGNIASSFNYGIALQVHVGSGNFVAVPPSSGVIVTTDHAGVAVGGAQTVSAVWDTVSPPTAPIYTHAVLGSLGTVTQVGKPNTIGSPGTTGLPGF